MTVSGIWWLSLSSQRGITSEAHVRGVRTAGVGARACAQGRRATVQQPLDLSRACDGAQPVRRSAICCLHQPSDYHSTGMHANDRIERRVPDAKACALVLHVLHDVDDDVSYTHMWPVLVICATQKGTQPAQSRTPCWLRSLTDLEIDDTSPL